MRARLAATCLALEAFLVFFATLAASAVSDLPDRTVWVGGGVLAVVCLLAAGVVGRPGGIVVGWVVQGLVLLTGVVLPAMVVMGLVFAALYAWFVVLGGRIDRERAAAAGREPGHDPGRTSPVS